MKYAFVLKLKVIIFTIWLFIKSFFLKIESINLNELFFNSVCFLFSTLYVFLIYLFGISVYNNLLI